MTREESVVRRIVFPIGLREKINKYATGMRTMRETANNFSVYGLTREMLRDIRDGVEVVERDIEFCEEETLKP